MIDFSRRELVELNGKIYEIGPLFEFVHSIEHLSGEGFYSEARRAVDQFSQEVRRDKGKYSLLIESLHKGIDKSQKVLEEIAQ